MTQRPSGEVRTNPRAHAAGCPRLHSTPPLRSAPSAFTLVEMIVVMIILGVLATVVVPRVTGLGSRQALAEARQVQDLVGLAAEKAASLGAPAALRFDGTTLTLLTQRSRSADAPQPAPDGGWRPDPLAESVTLSRLTIAAARADGGPLGGAGAPPAIAANAWTVEFLPARPRPALEIELRADDQSWTVRLDAEATRALLLGPGAAAPPQAARVIDLDDAGKGTTAW